jgi:hypothetical protein
MYGMLAKPPPSLRARILRALQGGPARGQGELMARVLGAQFTPDQQQRFNETLRSMLVAPVELRETKTQLPGTGWEGPPVYEYTYSLL